MANKLIDLTLLRSTKNTHVYCATAGAPIETVYVNKSALPSPPPAAVTLTLTWPEPAPKSSEEVRP